MCYPNTNSKNLVVWIFLHGKPEIISQVVLTASWCKLHFLSVTSDYILGWFLSEGQKNENQQHRVLVEVKLCCCSRNRRTFYWRTGEIKARKRRYNRMGSSSNSMEMPRPFFSEEAGLKSTQRTFDCIYLLLQKYAFLLLPSFVSWFFFL